MNEKTPVQQGLDSIRAAYEASNGLSWELVGQVVLVVAIIALTAYVGKHAKKFKDKL